MSGVDSRYAWWRLAASAAISMLGSFGMWGVVVVFPAVQADFGISRADVAFSYTTTMLGFGAGSILRAKDGTEVQGLTTASTDWIAAALGVTAGLGAWFITIAGTLVTLFVLTYGTWLEAKLIRFFGRNQNRDEETLED